MRGRSFYLEVFLAAFAALLLEIAYTRIFSFKLSSYFTYVIIAFALMGFGAGGAFVALSPRLRRVSPSRALAVLFPIGSVVVASGYVVIALLEVSTQTLPAAAEDLARLCTLCLSLFAGFLVIGLVIAKVFSARVESFPRLYLADLVGAGAACGLSVPLMLLLTPPGCVFLSAALLGAAGLPCAWRESRRLAPVSVLLTSLLTLGSLAYERLPEPVVDPLKFMGRTSAHDSKPQPIFSSWHPVFRVDVLRMPEADRRLLVHDGQLGSAMWRFENDVQSLSRYFEGSSRSIPFAVTSEKPHVLILGAAGGHEILASLYFDAAEITAVELNPVTVSLLRDEFADFTGHLPDHERVTLINAEGRSFLRGDSRTYDLIYFVAPDSYATMNAAQASGFVLVEAYLYTVEAIQEAARRLRPGGVLCMVFGEVDYEGAPVRTARYLATARRALEGLDVRDFGRHVLLATNDAFPFQVSTILISPTKPFSETQVSAFLKASRDSAARVRHANESVSDEPAISNLMISAPSHSLAALREDYSFEISPVSDNAPFFWHFVRWRDFFEFGGESRAIIPGDEAQGAGEAALLIMLALCALFSAIFLLLPFASIRRSFATLPAKGWALLYFSAVGLGFMGFEIILIQKLTLFLGYPTYTLTVTLFALLVFSGIGSLLTERYAARSEAPIIILTVLFGLTLFLQYGLDPVTLALAPQPLAVRIGVTLVPLGALGLCLGAFMPLGLRTLSRRTASERWAEYVAWGWAVNGFFSVIGSLLVTMLSMTFGFRLVMLLAFALYLLAGLALRQMARGPSTA